MAAVYPDEVWTALKTRITGTTIPQADRVSNVDVFTLVNSLAELEEIEMDRAGVLLIAQGPDTPNPQRGTCKDSIRFSYVRRYRIDADSIARALRDEPLVRARIKSLPSALSSCNPPKVDPSLWDYQSFAGLNALLVATGVSVDYEAVRPEV